MTKNDERNKQVINKETTTVKIFLFDHRPIYAIFFSFILFFLFLYISLQIFRGKSTSRGINMYIIHVSKCRRLGPGLVRQSAATRCPIDFMSGQKTLKVVSSR